MTDPIEEIVAPAAIERAMSVFEQFKDRVASLVRLARPFASTSSDKSPKVRPTRKDWLCLV